jgi:hypothetical protein
VRKTTSSKVVRDACNAQTHHQTFTPHRQSHSYATPKIQLPPFHPPFANHP